MRFLKRWKATITFFFVFIPLLILVIWWNVKLFEAVLG